MKKLLLMFMISLLLVSFVSAYDISEIARDGEDHIVITFIDEDFVEGGGFNLLFELSAIIPPFVNAGELITFKGEMLRTREISDLLGAPNELEITIAKFCQSCSNFMGQQIKVFKVSIPQYIQDKIRVETNVIFNVQMTTPSQKGKYRYRAIAKRNGVPIPAINIDYDSFTVSQDVPEVCPPADVSTSFENIPNGQRKIIEQISFVGSNCDSSIRITYNTFCNEGFKEEGSGADSSCVKIPETDPTPEDKTPDEIIEDKEDKACSPNEFCCQYNIFGAKGVECKTDCYRINEKIVEDAFCLGDKELGEVTDEEIKEILDKTDEALAKGEIKKCSLPIGSYCKPEGIKSIFDGSSTSNSCSTGWCQDATGWGGRCALAGTFSDGKIQSGYLPHPDCQEQAEEVAKEIEKKEGIDFCGWTGWAPDWFGTQCSTAWALVIGGIVLLFLFTRGGGGKGGK